MKKISYEPRCNFLQPQIVKNLLHGRVSVRIFYKNNLISFLSTRFHFFYMDFYILGLPTLYDVLYLNESGSSHSRRASVASAKRTSVGRMAQRGAR